MEAAETNFGSTVPAFVRSELQLWLNESQNSDGGFSYSCSGSSNIARTGAGLAMMTFVGIPTTDTRFQNALNYLDTHWTTSAGGWDSHFGYGGNYYAFYGVMKGARLPDPDVQMIGSRDWYADYANFITGDQEAYGGWLAYYGGHNPYLATAWAILTLKKTVVQPGPVADAGPDVPSHPPVVEITFDGTGSFHRDPSRNIVQYIWDFGDGSLPVEGPIVTHAFPAVYNPDGTIDWAATTRDYAVTLTVVDDSVPSLTDSDTAVVHITPPPYPPVADANGPYSVRPCETVTLDGSGSYDPNGALYPDPSHPWHGWIVSWEWDLDNDGEYDDATGETVTWSACDLGVHVVGLKVTNNFGASDEVDTVVNVGAIHDVAVDSVTPSADEVLVGEEVDIVVGVSNLGDYEESFDVAVYYDSTKIGDSIVSDLSPGGSQPISFGWDTTGVPEGCYDIKAVADTIPGEINTGNNIRYSDTQVCVTYNRPPTADPKGPYPGFEGSPVNFDGTGSSDPDGDLLTYLWDFGDSNTGTGPSPSHTYADNGLYNVCLTVTDPGGLSDTQCTTADIANVAPTATFNAPMYVIAGDAFDLSLTDPYDPSSADSAAGFEYAFDCGDGSGYGAWSSSNTATCSTSADEVGTRTVKGKIRDKDGGETEYTTTVTILPPSAATDSALCYYDREPDIDGQQFRLIFTPDMQLWPAYKLPASNPGQFFYNVFYTGEGPADFSITVPEPFETQGAMPVHVYTGVSVVAVSLKKCFVPDLDSEIYAGDFSGLSGLSDPGGFLYVTAHLDYGLKGTTGFIPNFDSDALDAETEEVLIPNLSDYTFSVSGSQNDSRTIQNSNDFKKIPGFGGLVTDGFGNPVEGATVEIYLDSALLGPATTDEDGWYMFVYKHTGKPADYTVALDGQSQQGTLKANKFAEANFMVE
jgi:PKD repeat protein